jgi:hypothetical protein
MASDTGRAALRRARLDVSRCWRSEPSGQAVIVPRGWLILALVVLVFDTVITVASLWHHGWPF